MLMTKTATLLATTLVLAVAGCGGGGGGLPAAQDPGPSLVVERFLQAANANDLETMTALFGTRDQTIVELDSKQKAERRMYVLATLLRHDDYTIRGQRAVPGRIRDATELLVELQQGEDRVMVPHLVVRRDNGGWIIERIDVEPLTRAR
jgi:hypothetical protein